MISNRILSGILSEFISDFELQGIPEEKVFEYFVTYLIVKRIHPEAFHEADIIKELDVDKGSNFGIDSFCLIVNNNLILKKEDIEIQQQSKRLDVRFLFVQSKTSDKVDSGDILKFTRAVKNVFEEKPEIPLTDEMLECRELIDEIYKYENVKFFTKDSPKCELYYATTSKPTTDKIILGLINSEKKLIEKSIPDLKQANIKLIDSEYLMDSYNEIENRFDVTINFKNNISFERIDDVSQAYIGYLHSKEFIKLICDNDGNIRRNLFYENVRDFQGIDNTVNMEISATLSEPKLHDKFVVLNNGITIVTRQFLSLGSNDYEISDYYIANGCQTSNVIYRYRESLKESKDFFVPIKIIHTDSSELITKIIKATNRQTPVPDEAFLALEKFHKRLQEFYARMSDYCREKLFYERRSKEFLNSEERIEKSRIINLHSQIRSFAAIILGEPQITYSSNPATILKEHGKKLFREQHSYHPYYLCSYILYKFYKLSNTGVINSKYNVFRFYIAWIVRVIHTESITLNAFDSKNVQKLCEDLIKDIDDEEKCKKMFEKAIEVLEIGINRYYEKYEYLKYSDIVRRKNFRDIFARK